MSKYSNHYYRFATQGKVPDEVIKNIRSVHINGLAGNIRVNYLAKDPETKKFKLFWVDVPLSSPRGIPNYALKYMQGLTQGRIEPNILRTVDTLAIRNNELVFTYKENGIARNGRVRLRGM